MRRIAKAVSPASFAAALLVFLLPFLSVQCDVPGGYGQMEAGEPFADGESASDFVAIGPAFWLAAALAIIGAVAGLVANRADP